MAVTKLLNLLAISCLAVIASFGPAPVAALSVDTTHQVRNNHHAVVAKKKRATASTKRCKPRATSPAPAPAPATTSNSPAPAPKPTTTKAAPKPSPTSSGSGSGSGAAKVGIAWPLGNDPAIKNFKTAKVSKYYTWSPWCVDDADAVGMKCCPMLWGPKQIGDFTKLVKPGYANCAMGFNEPNQAGQADIDPGYATQLWWQYLNPLKDQGYFLVSPACTNAPDGKTWMQNFLSSCNGCQIDAIALHWYGTDAQQFIDYVTDFHTTFGKPIWVTEFACEDFSSKNQQCSWDQVFSFMNTVTSWMDKTDYVQEYFAFGAMHDMYNVNPANQLLADNGFPTDLGRLYIGS